MGSMHKIGVVNTDATGTTYFAGNPQVSTTGTLLVHTRSVTGDWSFSALISPVGAVTDIIATVLNVTATGLSVGTPQTDYDTAGQGIPKPTQVLMTENSAGAIVADVYWLSAD